MPTMLDTALIMGGSTGAPILAFSAHHRCQSRKQKYYKLKLKKGQHWCPKVEFVRPLRLRNTEGAWRVIVNDIHVYRWMISFSSSSWYVWFTNPHYSQCRHCWHCRCWCCHHCNSYHCCWCFSFVIVVVILGIRCCIMQTSQTMESCLVGVILWKVWHLVGPFFCKLKVIRA